MVQGIRKRRQVTRKCIDDKPEQAAETRRPSDESDPLKRLQDEFTALHQHLNFYQDARVLVQLGHNLLAQKQLVAHGEWEAHLREFGKGLTPPVGVRELQHYMQCAKGEKRNGVSLLEQGNEKLSLRRFLRFTKASKRAERAKDREDARKAVMATASPDERYRVVHSDCRKYDWPDLDHAVADPPWDNLDHYRWVASLAREKLRQGGSLFVQCDTVDIINVGRILEEAGLTFVTELAILFENEFHPLWTLNLSLGHRPVLLFSKGEWNTKGLSRRIDSFPAEHDFKAYHEWQQPIRPWEYWLSGLTRAGELIGDPFACTATVGCALKAIGGRRYIGTEIDEENARVGQGRLAAQREGVRTVIEDQGQDTQRRMD